MKILDRYVIISFIKNYCISFMVLVGMYVVLDMVFNFGNLVQFEPNASAIETMVGTLRDMADYYFYQCFLFFTQLSGIIPVVAAAFTLMRLSRFNELTAMLAAGVPILRVSAPIVLAALLLNGLLLVDQELVIPRMIPKLVRDHGEIHKEARNWYSIEAMQDAQSGLLRVTHYYPNPPGSPPKMEIVDVIEREERDRATTDANGRKHVVKELVPFAHITADGAVWDAGSQSWDLVNGKRVTGIRPDEVRSPEMPCASYKSGVTPEEIALYRSGNFVELLSTERINQLLERPKSYGTLHLLRVKHLRFTQPLMNVILLLLAIPCVLHREPGQLKTGATKCLALMGVAMGSVFLTQQFANTPPRSIPPDKWAALMAWAPIFIFGMLSVYLLDRVKS
jgi:lipopolysaccharide export system permease protein